MAPNIPDQPHRFSRVRFFVNGRLVGGRAPTPNGAPSRADADDKDLVDPSTPTKRVRPAQLDVRPAAASRPADGRPDVSFATKIYRRAHQQAAETLAHIEAGGDAPHGETVSAWVGRTRSATYALFAAHASLLSAGKMFALRAPRLLHGRAPASAQDKAHHRALIFEAQRARQHVLSLFQAIEQADYRLDEALKALATPATGPTASWHIPDPFAPARRTLEVPLGSHAEVLAHLQWWEGRLGQLTTLAKDATKILVPFLSSLAAHGAPPPL